MTKPPSISVVMPLYNKAAFVREALLSVLAQTLPASEILVIDDGSTDGSAAEVNTFPEPVIRLITQANAGVSQARNRGIEAATGEYIAFLDADDRYQSGFLAEIARLIEKFPHAGIFCSGYTCFWEDGARIDRCLSSVPSGVASSIRNFYRCWCKGAFTFTSAIVVRRVLFEDPSLRFPPGEKLGEDQDLWFRIAERWPIAYINKPLVDYRMGVMGSATQANALLDILPCYRRLDERLVNGVVPPHLRRSARRLFASHLLNIAHTHLSLGNLQAARAMLADRRAIANPVYYFRTLLAVTTAGVRSSIRA